MSHHLRFVASRSTTPILAELSERAPSAAARCGCAVGIRRRGGSQGAPGSGVVLQLMGVHDHQPPTWSSSLVPKQMRLDLTAGARAGRPKGVGGRTRRATRGSSIRSEAVARAAPAGRPFCITTVTPGLPRDVITTCHQLLGVRRIGPFGDPTERPRRARTPQKRVQRRDRAVDPCRAGASRSS